ncbi:hypothetical protein EON77_21870, partial [bacterium]
MLEALGLDEATIATVQLGLREPYDRVDGRRIENVLTFPVGSDGGRRRFASVNLPGVTLNPEHAVCWSPGEATSVTWGGGGSVLIVCGSPLEVWQLGQAAGRKKIDATIVASSQAIEAPACWGEPRFWATWKRVIVVDTVATPVRTRIAEWAKRPVEHAPHACASSCDELPVRLRHDDWLLEVLSSAVLLGRVDIAHDLMEACPGDYCARTLTLHGGFRDGRMYYPTLVERRRQSGSHASTLLHSYETVVIRSDGAVLEAEVLPAPPGTPAARRVHALDDGTRIDAPPAASRHATWSLASIQSFVAARAAGEDPCRRPTAAVLQEVHATLA